MLAPIQPEEKMLMGGQYTCYTETWCSREQLPIFRQILDMEFKEMPNGHFCSLRPSGVTEHWTLHQMPNRARILRCERRSNGYDNGMNIWGTLFYHPDTRPDQMYMKVMVGDQLAAEASYQFFEERVIIERRAFVKRGEYGDFPEVFPLPQGYLVDFGRMTISRGFVLRSILNSAPVQTVQEDRDVHELPRTPVFSPDNDGGFNLLYSTKWTLSPELEYYTLAAAGTAPFEIKDQRLAGTEYQIGIYDQQGSGIGYEVLMDNNGVLLKDGMGYRFYLTDYESLTSERGGEHDRAARE